MPRDSKAKRQDAKLKKTQKIKERKAEKDKIAQKAKENAQELQAQEGAQELKAALPRSSDYCGAYWHKVGYRALTGEAVYVKKKEFGYGHMARYRHQKWRAGEKYTCQNEHCKTPDAPHNPSGFQETKINGEAAWVCLACSPMFTCVPEDNDEDMHAI